MNFAKISDLACNCGCGKAETTFDFIEKLNRIQANCPYSLKIIDWCRCVQYNNILKKNIDGHHLSGMEIDLECFVPFERYTLVNLFYKSNFNIIKIGLNTLHIALDTSVGNVMFVVLS